MKALAGLIMIATTSPLAATPMLLHATEIKSLASIAAIARTASEEYPGSAMSEAYLESMR